MQDSVFFDNLRELCHSRRTSVSAVAEEIGLSSASASGWRKGSIPKSDTLQKLADYFGVTTDFLLKGDAETFTNTVNGAISGSSVIIGSRAEKIISSAGGQNLPEISETEAELLRIFRAVGIRGQTKIMAFAYEVEDQE